ncbi:MAG: biotin--[acetyl-CoA-carboxylase] ligase [Chloroflexota bacterium]
MSARRKAPPALKVEAIAASLRSSAIGHRILYLPVVTSTMDIACQEAERGAPEGTVVVAEEQTAGRARFGRQWLSTPNQNLAFSVLLYPSRRTSTRLSTVTPVAVLRAITKVTGLSATLKWPNDVRLGEKKVCGILIEAAFQDSQVRYAILGIGINVNFNPAEDPQADFAATSLAAELGKHVSREELLQAILTELGMAYTHLREWDRVWDEWRSSLETLGRQVQVRWGEHLEEGVAEDVDSEGNLLLRRADGTLVTLAAGEVTFQL